MIEANAIIYEKENLVKTGKVSLPEMKNNHLLLETIYTFVSTGTELRVLNGHYGAKNNFPLIPGYAGVGKIIDMGSEVIGYKIGDIVAYCPDNTEYSKALNINAQWGGQMSKQLIPYTEKPVIIPPEDDPVDYASSQVAAISLRGTRAAQPQKDETVIVLGQGIIGAFSAVWFVSMGCRVIVVDYYDMRLNIALKNNVHVAVNLKEKNAEERILSYCDNGADIVVETSGTTSGIELALKLLKAVPNGFRAPIRETFNYTPRLVLQANYIDKISLNLFNCFKGEAIKIISPMDRNTEERQTVIEKIRRKEINIKNFIDKVRPYTEASDAYQNLQKHPENNFSLIFSWK